MSGMSSGTGRKEPFYRLTSDDRGGVIVIVAYSWIFISATVALIRFSLAWNQRLRFRVDDGTFLAGVGLALATSACYHRAVDEGLGRRIAAVSQASLEQYYKMMYVAELLGILAMASAKASVVLLSHRVAPRSFRQYYTVLGIVIAWTLFSTLAIAFQCPLPSPWDIGPHSCPTAGNVQYPIIIFNILTDFMLATWIMPTLWKLLMDNGKRVTVMVLFGSRLIVCGFEIVQLSSVGMHIHKEDVTFYTYGRVIWGICVVHLSVLLATIPRTNRFLAALQSMHTTTHLTEYELTSSFSTSYALSKGKVSQGTAIVPSTEPTSSNSRERSSSPSNRSREPLVDASLQLTPSVEQHFSTQITSVRGEIQKERRRTNDRKYQTDDWRKYLHRNRDEQHMDLGTMFSWTSRTNNSERIVQTTEVTQEVEIVEPRQSRWILSKPRKLSRGT